MDPEFQLLRTQADATGALRRWDQVRLQVDEEFARGQPRLEAEEVTVPTTPAVQKRGGGQLAQDLSSPCKRRMRGKQEDRPFGCL